MPLLAPVDATLFVDEERFGRKASLEPGYHAVMVANAVEKYDRKIGGITWTLTFVDIKGERRLSKAFLVDPNTIDAEAKEKVNKNWHLLSGVSVYGDVDNAKFKEVVEPKPFIGVVAVIEVEKYKPSDSARSFNYLARVVPVGELNNSPWVSEQDVERIVADFKAFVEAKAKPDFDPTKFASAQSGMSAALSSLEFEAVEHTAEANGSAGGDDMSGVEV